eukprot:4019588-Pyramimonas_sp.AAC.1
MSHSCRIRTSDENTSTSFITMSHSCRIRTSDGYLQARKSLLSHPHKRWLPASKARSRTPR